MTRFHTIEDLHVAGRRVLLRADLNVPVKDGKVTDATRIKRLAPTIETLMAKDAKTIVMSHFGRPKGVDPSQSLEPLVGPLSQLIGGKTVQFASDCIGPEAQKVVDALKPGEVALLENLRFHPEEEKNDPGFAKQLAALGDLYIDDAFSAAHRAHASIEALAHLLPNAAGKLMQAELEALGAALEQPQRPVMALVGGSKVSTKLDLLKFIISKVDRLANPLSTLQKQFACARLSKPGGDPSSGISSEDVLIPTERHPTPCETPVRSRPISCSQQTILLSAGNEVDAVCDN
jgi:phosphoglycerate kinase